MAIPVTSLAKPPIGGADEELVVLRLMDTRIANVLIPKMREVDWSVLMTPVHEVMLGHPVTLLFLNHLPGTTLCLFQNCRPVRSSWGNT
ncbi:hypothetical protein [Providencia hangzhouensis]|uniref:hypothetical protein n=1 Tax=Providencia hangzhouensis TaxID=3031799 RepID=UPI0034DD4448